MIANFSDLNYIYKLETDLVVKFTNLPNNFEKQKVSLAMNVFDKKNYSSFIVK